jgi:RNA polymerase sigma factor (sigma-70 family)
MTYTAVKDYEVTIRIRNNWMLKAMRKAGFETGISLSRASGVRLRTIYLFLGLKLSFMKNDGTWRPNIIKIADTLGCAPDMLVPPQHLREILKKNKGTFEADFEEVAALVDYREQGNPLLLIEQKETSQALFEAMRLRLTPREQRVLAMIYGLGSELPHTLEASAKRLMVTRERVRQIQYKALRKMKLGCVGNIPTTSITSRDKQRVAGEVLRDAVRD